MEIKVVNNSNNELPKYATALSAGMDIRAFITGPESFKEFGGDESYYCKSENQIVIAPMSRVMVDTGIFMALPQGYEMQVRSRSGLSLKEGLMVVQGVGTIDADYRGECKVCLINLSKEPAFINGGDRIGQFVFKKFEQAEWNQQATLEETERKGGFGHTGKQ